MGFATAHHKITLRRKRGHGPGLGQLPNIWRSPSIFTQWLKLATSNLVHSLGLLRPIITPIEKVGMAFVFGLGELPKISWFHFNLYTKTEARDFEFGIQFTFATAHHKTTPRGIVGVALG